MVLAAAEIALAVVLLAGFCLIVWYAAFGSPRYLARFWLRVSDLPQDDRERFRRCNFFGYIFDYHGWRDDCRHRRDREREAEAEDQLRALERFYEEEARLRSEIEAMEARGERPPRHALRRLERYRYAMAVRTREERRRRRFQWLQEQDLMLTGDPDAERSHVKDTLSREEKRAVLNMVLVCHRFHSSDKKDVMEGSNGNNSLGRKAKPTAEEDQSSDDEENCLKTKSSHESLDMERVCAICLDMYEDGDMLCGRPAKCAHRFHSECLKAWLESRHADYCPACRTPIITEAEWSETHELLTRSVPSTGRNNSLVPTRSG